ncbi:MAG: 4,5-DOPA dioxygenase extradiol [Gammaproteobacteria bacterium]
MKMPVLFVGHGNPMNAIERNEFFRGWQEVARRLPKPAAILCISAHWETQGAWVTATELPQTIHDFYGFPKALFNVRYPAPGSPALAARVAGLVTTERVQQDPGRGLDHGAWSVLVAMYPAADIPVVQLGMDTRLPGSHHYAIGMQLAPLRDEHVLVMGSGNIVHNLPLFSFHDPRPLDWALRCDLELRRRIAAREHEALIDYDSLGDDARLAVPTPEHYYPLLYALALQQEGEPAEFFNARVASSVSMTSVLIGEALRA